MAEKGITDWIKI